MSLGRTDGTGWFPRRTQLLNPGTVSAGAAGPAGLRRGMQPSHTIASIMITAILSALAPGCGSSDTYSRAPAGNSAANAPAVGAASSADAEAGFAGVWQGTTASGCAAFGQLPSRCNAQQNVTITLLEGPDAKYTGRYTCAYGNMDCYHANTTGKVMDVSNAGRRMTIRVLMPDATSCIFTGIDVNQSINGGYSCYQGGGLIEQGSWQARRSY
jgi:hypothetical protein